MKTQPVAYSDINSPQDLIGRHVTLAEGGQVGEVLGPDPTNSARVLVRYGLGSYSVHWLQLRVQVES